MTSSDPSAVLVSTSINRSVALIIYINWGRTLMTEVDKVRIISVVATMYWNCNDDPPAGTVVVVSIPAEDSCGVHSFHCGPRHDFSCSSSVATAVATVIVASNVVVVRIVIMASIVATAGVAMNSILPVRFTVNKSGT